MNTKVENVGTRCRVLAIWVWMHEAKGKEERKLTLHADEKHITPAFTREEGAALSLAFQQRVRRHGRSHADALDAVELELLAFGDLAPLCNAQNATNSICQLR